MKKVSNIVMFVTLVIAGLITTTATAQPVTPTNGSISGTVTDISSGMVISGANVTADDMTATTDANGSYNISIAAGTYDAAANATGYQDNITTGVVVASGNETSLNFALTPVGVSSTSTLVSTPTNNVTSTATPTETGTVTSTETATNTATPAATTTTSPGFESGLAIAGLGAVAYLVLRRRK